MKTAFRSIGLTLIGLSILLFLYGSIKTARGKQVQNSTVELAPGITAVKENGQEKLSKQTFRTSLVFFLGGAVLTAFSLKRSKQR